MLRHFLFTALRNLWRNKVYSLISILSLGIGLAVSAFALLYVKKELGYDRAWPDAERMVRLLVRSEGIPGVNDVETNNVDVRAWPALPDHFAEFIEEATRVTILQVKVSDSELNTGGNLWFVDPGFARVFQPPVLEGSLEQVLAGPGYLAVEERFAMAQDPVLEVGHRISLENPTVGSAREFEVAAIYRTPTNISLAVDFRLLTLIDDAALPMFRTETMSFNNWENASQVWLKVRKGTSLDGFNAMQRTFVQDSVTTYAAALGPERRISDHLFYRWQKVTDMHLNPTVIESRNGAASGKLRVATFAVVGVLVLLAGCSNAVGLGLAAALERRREIGIRKAAGAQGGDILWHYLGEAILLALLALLPAIAVVELLQPAFYRLFPATFMISPVEVGWRDYALLLLITVFTGCASGFYPGLLLARLRPHAVLRPGAAVGTRSSQRLRSMLVGAQFCVAAILLVATTALYTQLAVTRAQPLGFERENRLLYFQPGLPGQVTQDVLRNALASEPGITQVVPGSMSPNMNLPPGVNVMTLQRRSGDFAETKTEMFNVHAGFAEFFGMPVLAGRYFDAALDDMGTASNFEEASKIERRIVLNRSAANALGYDGPQAAIGEQLFYPVMVDREGTMGELRFLVIGVVEDSMFSSLQRRPGPQVHSLMTGTNQGGLTFVQYRPELESTIAETLHELSRQLNGTALSGIRFINDYLEAAFRQERNESLLLLICGALALLLACLGLYGLAAFAIARNVKEVGVRKVLGAGVGTILRLYLWRFARPVLVAIAVACPVAVYFVLRWIEKFPYQLERVWLPALCLAAGTLVLLIALTTVGVLTLRAALAKPVRCLRHE